MPAIAALVLNNNAAVAKTFAPAGIDKNGVKKYNTVTAASYDARDVVTHLVSPVKSTSDVVRMKQKILVPTMDAVDTTKKIAENYITIEYVLSKKATLTQRLDVLAFAKGVMYHAVTTAGVTDFEDAY